MITIIARRYLIALSFIICPLSFSVALTSCDDANEYEDTNTDNPSWVTGYNDSLKIAHPQTLAGTRWMRGNGLKVNAYGQEVQGFVESLNFVSADSVAVKMSQGTTSGTWVDESNTQYVPYYEYTYSETTGSFEILKRVVDDRGAVSKSAIFTGVAVSGTREVITVAHFGDTPVQSYLVKQ
ncbi:MAG: hypothetical protein K6G32_05900 [Prevotella sp.]|nr:hypothetical protein [Prevotella sp.]